MATTEKVKIAQFIRWGREISKVGVMQTREGPCDLPIEYFIMASRSSKFNRSLLVDTITVINNKKKKKAIQ